MHSASLFLEYDSIDSFVATKMDTSREVKKSTNSISKTNSNIPESSSGYYALPSGFSEKLTDAGYLNANPKPTSSFL